MMSQQELRKVEVIAQASDGRITRKLAAETLHISERQVYRLVSRYRHGGASGLAHKSRGRRSNRRYSEAKRDYILDLVKENYPDFGPTLAAEYLGQRHEISVSSETLRKWMMAAGMWADRKQRKVVHQLRNRRDCYGELIQIDGSDHDWFEDRAPRCTLLVFIDDATSAIMELRFVPSESTFSYMRALEVYLERHGRPVAFYSDKHSVFRIAKPHKNGNGMTQFTRALAELNIDLICADTSQAKGRVERANRTLQDRLVKELRIEGISDIDDANRFLAGYAARHNAKFARIPRVAKDLHRPLEVAADRLAQVLCVRDDAYVGKDLAINYDRKRYILERTPENTVLIGKRISVYAFADGRVELSWDGRTLPYRIYDKRPRISSAAVVENKRLGDVLAYIKSQQDMDAKEEVAEDGVRAVKGNTGVRNDYVPTGKTGGRRAKTRSGVLLPQSQ